MADVGSRPGGCGGGVAIGVLVDVESVGSCCPPKSCICRLWWSDVGCGVRRGTWWEGDGIVETDAWSPMACVDCVDPAVSSQETIFERVAAFGHGK